MYSLRTGIGGILHGTLWTGPAIAGLQQVLRSCLTCSARVSPAMREVSDVSLEGLHWKN